jgi:hypothetical protein
VSFIPHLGGIFNLQFLAQPTPAAFTSVHVGGDSYNVLFMCAFLPALPGPPREVMHVYQHASYTLPCLPRVCTIHIICVLCKGNTVNPSINPSIYQSILQATRQVQPMWPWAPTA